jgi:regulator of sigma E protease
MTAQLILALSILVTLHELGHFLAARTFGIKVEKFYLFFDAWGIRLFRFKKGDTEYGLGWLPFGGYVKIAGMIDESLDKDAMAQPPQPWEFRSKPAWQRLIVMLGGVTMNVLLGVVIFAFTLLHYKQDYLPNSEVKGIYVYKLGEELGLKNGDRITAINGKSFERFDDLLSTRVLFGATLSVIRNGKDTLVEIPENFYRKVNSVGRGYFIGTGPLTYHINEVTPGDFAEKAGLKAEDVIVSINNEKIEGEDFISKVLAANKEKQIVFTIERDKKTIQLPVMISDKGTIGIGYLPEPEMNPDYKMRNYTLASAISFGTGDAFEAIISNAKGFKQIFKGKEKFQDSVQGPIGIAKIFGGKWEWPKFWFLTGLISMILAFMNILPIPALDGGHVLFLLTEAVTRRKFSDTFMEKVQVVGMIIILALMVFVIGNDIWKNFIK